MHPGERPSVEPRRPRLVWVWRGLLALGLVAASLVVAFAATGRPGAAVKWAVVAVFWAALGWWLRGLVRSSSGDGGL